MIFPGFVDRVYLDAPSELQLDNGLGDVITIKNTKYELEIHLIFLFCYSHDFSCFTCVFIYFTLLSFWHLQLVRYCFVEPASADGSMLQRFCLCWKCTGIEILPSCNIIANFHNCQASWKLSFIFLIPSSGQLWLRTKFLYLAMQYTKQLLVAFPDEYLCGLVNFLKRGLCFSLVNCRLEMSS